MSDKHAGLNRSLRYLVPVLAAGGLHLISLSNYVLFHSLVEVLRVVVLIGVFVLAWHSRQWSKNDYIVFVGIAFVFVGVMELLHALSYKGTGVFDGYDANLPTQLWIAARYLESLSMIAAGFVVGRRWNPTLTFVIYGALTAAMIAVIFTGLFPDCYIEGAGQTPFKVASEYIISGLFFAAIVPILRVRLFDRAIRSLLVASFATSAAAELAFSRYVSIYGLANEIGHLLLLLSTYFLYRAVLVTGIVNPFSLLFQSLKDSEERYARLANAAKEGVLIYDGLRIVETNASLATLFGYDEHELTDVSLGDLFALEGRRDTLVAVQGGSAPAYETRGLRKDGTTFPVEWSGSVVSYQGRDMRVGLVRDLTREKREEEERRILQVGLQHASRLSEIGRVAAALAHELNQPLTAVTAYIGACRRVLGAGPIDESKTEKLLDVMVLANAQALRAAEIIRRVREFIGTGQTERAIEEAASVIREASTLALAAAKHNAVAIRLGLAVSGRVLVNKVQIQQIVVNLVSNAIDAMESCERKELGITLAARSDYIEVAVSDTGSGLPEEIADRLFKPFSSTKTQGMGIGLSVCREIVEAHHGKIWVDPNPGGGTVFRFTLPLVRDEMLA